MTAITQENHFFGSFIKGLGSLFSLAPVSRLNDTPAKTPEEISAEAWKMTGDAIYKAMGKTPPPPPEPLSDAEIKQIMAQYMKGRGAAFIKEMEENQELTLMVTITTPNMGERNVQKRKLSLTIKKIDK